MTITQLQPAAHSFDAHGLRPQVHGKFLTVGDEKFYVRGVTYGTFQEQEDGCGYSLQTVERDFARMAEYGINAVRVYTVPPRWLLDIALRYGLRVMVGLPWEQHITFLQERTTQASIERRVREGVRSCAGHPAVLCFAIGNEIPSSIVRWHGARRVERFLKRLYDAVKDEDPGSLVTYVNFPSTEYLELDFVDIFTFNVYLESRNSLERYLARLQNLAGDRPLLMAEIGLDSLRNGTDVQAEVLDWQVRTAFAAGSIGTFVFAWTDEWHRGGHAIEDWDFGLTTRDRQAKPALFGVAEAYADAPFPAGVLWPKISVVVCTYNGASTLADCLTGLKELEYPSYEVIVVDDGSTDGSAGIARTFNVRLITTENHGLSSARNTGLHAATGEIVAYTDDDARPDPHWLMYLANNFMRTTHAAMGGPNIAPAGDGPIAECVANAPGGPVHVLLTDEIAEHIPGCNMAFRREQLLAIGGFDPRYRAAGDDVDVCWRLQDQGWTIGFCPAAMVWHHRRNSIKAYWKQQQGYGKAEALLEQKWPERYNAVGHLAWSGRLYGKGWTQGLNVRSGRIYQGTWGTALFQSLYRPAPGLLSSLPLMPEWWLFVLALAGISLFGIAFSPLLISLPLLLVALMAPIAQSCVSALRASFSTQPRTRMVRVKLRLLTGALHLIQPIARLRGRIQSGLTPWRKRRPGGGSFPWARVSTSWSEEWTAIEVWLGAVEASLQGKGNVVRRGGVYDSWDLEVRGGVFAHARAQMVIEEHGAGRQLIRFRSWPRINWMSISIGLGLVIIIHFILGGFWFHGSGLVIGALLLAGLIIRDAGTATAALRTVPNLNRSHKL